MADFPFVYDVGDPGALRDPAAYYPEPDIVNACGPDAFASTSGSGPLSASASASAPLVPTLLHAISSDAPGAFDPASDWITRAILRVHAALEWDEVRFRMWLLVVCLLIATLMLMAWRVKHQGIFHRGGGGGAR